MIQHGSMKFYEASAKVHCAKSKRSNQSLHEHFWPFLFALCASSLGKIASRRARRHQSVSQHRALITPQRDTMQTSQHFTLTIITGFCRRILVRQGVSEIVSSDLFCPTAAHRVSLRSSKQARNCTELTNLQLDGVFERQFKFMRQLKLCAHPPCPIATLLHLLHVNRTRKCTELPNLHLPGIV
jgi:hypothetical protein